jgi:antitoxin FitA
MPVNLSIKNAPDNIVELVRRRAERNHRSLRGELLAIIEEAVRQQQVWMTPREILEQGQRLGLKTASDSVEIIRKMRDERYGG